FGGILLEVGHTLVVFALVLHLLHSALALKVKLHQSLGLLHVYGFAGGELLNEGREAIRRCFCECPAASVLHFQGMCAHGRPSALAMASRTTLRRKAASVSLILSPRYSF